MKMSPLKLIVVILFATFFNACNTSETEDPVSVDGRDILLQKTTQEGIVYCGEAMDFTLWAGQTINAGTLTVYNDKDNLYLTFNSTEGYQDVTENIKVWAGTDLLNLPVNSQGVPVNGDFPYKLTVASGEKIATMTIPLAGIVDYDETVCGKQIIHVVAHVDIKAPDGNGGYTEETAYAGDIPGETPRWWFRLEYTPQCCTDTPPPAEGTMETAFIKFDNTGAYGMGYVFTTNKKSNPEKYASLSLTQNRWGWAGNITSQGTYDFDIYAGAGLNNILNGMKVGTGTVMWDGAKLQVTYETLPGFSMVEVHIYAGDTKPMTIAPGQYGFVENFGLVPADFKTSFTKEFDVTDTDGDGIWVIAHAVAYGVF